ncbi:hypothetical protein [Agrococcus sp. DT81.2]|uniref:hypothetical protein n=1 Tax=Agrococcus sp. DT81.2 TaxID=3393414 RepID=UPI003CE4DFB9
MNDWSVERDALGIVRAMQGGDMEGAGRAVAKMDAHERGLALLFLAGIADVDVRTCQLLLDVEEGAS